MLYTGEQFERDVKKLLKEDKNLLNEVAMEVNSWCGCLGDDEIIDMDYLNDYFVGSDPIDILLKAYNGYDEDGGQFNPNNNYFYFNGYANFVSCNDRDYTDYLDDIVDNMIINMGKIDLPSEIQDLRDVIDTEVIEEE